MRNPLLAGALLALGAAAAQAAEGEQIDVSGELIDTWCYYSGVMGGPEAVVGSAHHICAIWCAAGGIPVGLKADDGTVYMVVKWQSAPDVVGDESLLKLQSHEVEARGAHYKIDGIDYLFVAEVVADEGITNHNHEDFGVVPGFAIPDPE